MTQEAVTTTVWIQGCLAEHTSEPSFARAPATRDLRFAAGFNTVTEQDLLKRASQVIPDESGMRQSAGSAEEEDLACEPMRRMVVKAVIVMMKKRIVPGLGSRCAHRLFLGMERATSWFVWMETGRFGIKPTVGVNNSQFLLSWPGELYYFCLLDTCAGQNQVLQVKIRGESLYST